ncbi:hypothetical protein P5673_000876 [Acropora cervicornis]|uniref:Uncharacterized protein n=1 Tax=Acropora cervicornis TaxID=6130 RepID=A0AAD9R556_ACRCE|nr:hypothetical protein P5673_000876 [Acropora cervicornis]
MTGDSPKLPNIKKYIERVKHPTHTTAVILPGKANEESIFWLLQNKSLEESRIPTRLEIAHGVN